MDVAVVDGVVNGIGSQARELGSLLRWMQSGNIRSYATWVLVGAVALVVTLGLVGGAP